MPPLPFRPNGTGGFQPPFPIPAARCRRPPFRSPELTGRAASSRPFPSQRQDAAAPVPIPRTDRTGGFQPPFPIPAAGCRRSRSAPTGRAASSRPFPSQRQDAAAPLSDPPNRRDGRLPAAPPQKEIDKNPPSVSLALRNPFPVQPEQDSDKPIRDALARSDSIALDWIWDAYSPRLLAFATALLCSRHDAEETMQNVFVKIARNRARLAAARSLKAYLFTMTRNEAYTLARQRGRREISVDPQSFGLIPATPADLPAPEEAAAAARLLAALPEKQREVVVLKIYEEMTFDEIARSLRISLNTAASRYRYGLEKLRQRLKEGSP
ncbi:MAG: sigma-70 family RNA polymerase sigma factor [Opitutae bacterium]|nr:sigma-70 family RNA polymerase sigma factor [Opitutae bacterium]